MLFYFIMFSLPGQAYAGSNVVINEIAWMGSKISEVDSKNWWRYEWFEIYNNTPSLISLDGWKIELYSDDLDWTLNLKGEIPANGYFLAVSSDKIFPSYSQNYSDLKGNFLNNGQKIILRDSSGELIEEIDCSSNWFAGDNKNKLTMERVSSFSDPGNPENWQSSNNPNGTPGQKNDDVFYEKIQDEAAASIIKEEKELFTYQDKLIAQSSGYLFSGSANSIFLTAILCALSSGFAIIFLKNALNKRSSLDK